MTSKPTISDTFDIKVAVKPLMSTGHLFFCYFISVMRNTKRFPLHLQEDTRYWERKADLRENRLFRHDLAAFICTSIIYVGYLNESHQSDVCMGLFGRKYSHTNMGI